MDKATCKNCNQPIHTTPWRPGVTWSHGPLWQDNQIGCVATTEAEPR